MPLAANAGRGAEVVGAWLLTYAVHSTVLLLGVWWIVSRRALGWSPAAQHTLWRAGMLAGFVTATVQQALPWRPLAGSMEVADGARRAVAAVQVTQRAGSGQTRPGWLREPVAGPIAIPAGGASLPAGDSLLVGPRQRLVVIEADVEADAGEQGAALVREIALRSSLQGGASAGTRLAPGIGPLERLSDEVVRVVVVGLTPAAFGVVVWLLVATGLLVHLTVQRHRLRALLSDRRPSHGTPASLALRYLSRLAGVRDEVVLSTSDRLQAPAAVSGQEIVLPARALRDLTLAEQEGVIAHELAHVVRRDTRWLRVALGVERLAWFQPLNRVARRQMQLSAEFAADAWAVQVTRQPLRLAQALARVAEWLAPGATSTAHLAPGADGSPLVQRVRRLTTNAPETSRHGPRVALAAVVLASAAALVVLPRVSFEPAAAPLVRRTATFNLQLASQRESPRRVHLGAAPPSNETRTGIRFVRVHKESLPWTHAPGLPDTVGAPKHSRVMVISARAAS